MPRKGRKQQQKRNKSVFSGSIPEELERGLINRYEEVINRYRIADYEHHETSVGKFCEVVLRIFENILEGRFTLIGGHINTEKILNKVINSNDREIDMSLRKKVAPLIRILLVFRNDRDAAHVGGVDLGAIDTNFTFYAVRWIYGELIRMYGGDGVSVSQIQREIDKVAEVVFPDIIKIGDKKVITNPKLTSEKEVLLSLGDGEKNLEDLFEMNKEQNKTRFKNKLKDMERGRLIYFRSDRGVYILLPEGASQ